MPPDLFNGVDSRPKVAPETEAPPDDMSWLELADRFPDDEAAREWFEEVRWGGKAYCPHCGSEKVSTCTYK